MGKETKAKVEYLEADIKNSDLGVIMCVSQSQR